ncbi:site-specific recombinase XerD [Mucilaginibacter gracilis]|uniref:Site-specific recombinase XerD n=1 Tax=Mucilaginibacter gracilis TaxID=423350 RepID=A0A495J132_9SPHI|nr:tyrosine-type recombinase/integrase [Mucilaginibacter gracilis]RKR82670.1 site-specific recombinase XerD [Mucilaginibacter gracilis]
MKQIKSQKEDSILIQSWSTYDFKLFPGSKSTKPYLHFQFLNPKTNKEERQRKLAGLKKGESISVLKKQAKEMVPALIHLLSNGWNPIENTFNDLPITPLSTIQECIAYWLKEREIKVSNNAMKPKGLKTNGYLMDYFTKWLTEKKYLFRKANTFTQIDIDNFLQKTSQERKWGKVTYNCYRQDLGTFFNFLLTLKIISENPVNLTKKKSTKKDSSRFKIYEEDELKNVVELLRKDARYLGLYIATKFIFHYNIRPIELTRIQVSDIDFSKRILTLAPEKTKNGDEAVFKLNDETFILLDDLVADQPPDFFVFGHKCKPSRLQIHQDYFGQKWRSFREDYNLSSHLKLYALKHSSNYYDLEGGVSFEEIRQRNRHSSLQVTTLYIRERLNKNQIKASGSLKF